MITYAQLAELSDQTSLPLIEIIRALSRSAGNSAAARARLMEGNAVQVEEPCPPDASPPDGV